MHNLLKCELQTRCVVICGRSLEMFCGKTGKMPRKGYMYKGWAYERERVSKKTKIKRKATNLFGQLLKRKWAAESRKHPRMKSSPNDIFVIKPRKQLHLAANLIVELFSDVIQRNPLYCIASPIQNISHFQNVTVSTTSAKLLNLEFPVQSWLARQREGPGC